MATLGHRDTRDGSICVVSAFGNYRGGQLCLFEPGLIFELEPGDVLAFPSSKITHFNLDFEGERHSIVLHTEAALAGHPAAFPTF